ncbi:ThiF family adenylyltransferase [Phormidium sp. FACHB-1136]|uniref:ThiF family adenylyltransferase n=1 Tax=Phormidium sp. FACHB-1136 TaxID=2692848 RepID=UPI0016832153|nr:ThiF family adenylyltransferase [Phormidium sp. FACHB-1136]MBD2429390.1 ThiF family adenylyltransferase [Phormidium sp. FACHB-1136]
MSTLPFNLDAINAKPVVLAPAQTIELWIIGCGGTGSFLVQLLCRIALALTAQGRTTRLVLVDPDQVEAKNVTRQCFCEAEVGLNKAQTLALRYSAAFGVAIEAIAEPFRPSMLWDSRYETLQILCGCVDNAAARQSIAEAIEAPRYHSLASPWWIDGGNSQHHGQVLVGNRKSTDPKDYAIDTVCRALPIPSVQAPDLLVPRPEEQGPSGLSCAEMAMAQAQSLLVNPQVATLMGRYVVDLLNNTLTQFATHFDQQTGTMISQYTTTTSIAAALSRSAQP